MRRTYREIAETVITAAVIFVVLQGTTQTFRVQGPSMLPTIVEGQHLLVNKFIYTRVNNGFSGLLPWVDDSGKNAHYLFHGPQRGDVVVFEPPGGRETDFVKRVIGLPGDTVDIRNGSVYVNGTPLDEIARTKPTPGGSVRYPLTVPEGQYFVLGDNRRRSNDSRAWGFVPADAIVGRVWVRYWPIAQFRVFPSGEQAQWTGRDGPPSVSAGP